MTDPINVVTYKLSVYPNQVLKLENDIEVATIPDDMANIDWREYQEWLAVPNTPLPAE